MQPTTGVKACNLATKLSKPTEAEAQVLGKLFPTSKTNKRPFDPSKELVVADAKKLFLMGSD